MFILFCKLTRQHLSLFGKKRQKSELRRGRTRIPLYFVSQVGMVVIAVIEGDVCERFFRRLMPDGRKHKLISYKIDELLGRDAHVLPEGPFQLPRGGTMPLCQFNNTDEAFVMPDVGNDL